jgi:RNA polymerase sigma-70 factor (ECF subfamily)
MDSRPNDETLLLAVAERDMGTFRTLYERHAGWLAIRLAPRCNDRDLVADAIQDTFVAVWQRPRSGSSSRCAWWPSLPRSAPKYAPVDIQCSVIPATTA